MGNYKNFSLLNILCSVYNSSEFNSLDYLLAQYFIINFNNLSELNIYDIASTMNTQFVKQPFEEMVMVVSQKINMNFSVLRARTDFVFIVLSLLFILVFKLNFNTLREGTFTVSLLYGKEPLYIV